MDHSEKILLVQLFSNGDCLYATAVARQIKEDHPGCHLTWAIAAYCRNIIAHNPYVDDVLIIEEENINTWKELPPHVVFRFDTLLKEKKVTKIIQTQLIGSRYADYDQCIRSSLFSGYDRPVTVPVAPVIGLSDREKEEVNEFAAGNGLKDHRHIFLLEYAPKSGQSDLSSDKALAVARELTKRKDTLVIFGSGGNIQLENTQMLSAEKLNLRQVAYLSNYCTFLLGCSSGITWAVTSGISKTIPMLQVLDPDAYWLNSVVNDHSRFSLPVDHIIEITDASTEAILACLAVYMDRGFAAARNRYHRKIKLKFRMTRGIIVDLLHKRNFKGAVKHARINLKQHGFNYYLIKAVALGFLTAPFIPAKK